METNYTDPTDAFLSGMYEILKRGDIVDVRGKRTKEVILKSFVIQRPLERCITIRKRHDNIFAKIAEVLWMLAGRNDIQWLSHYLPRAPQFSDDGFCWRGGYGPRLRHWQYGETDDMARDQLAYIVNLLTRDPLSRQAVATIWDPVIDTQPGKDIPCNNWVHFLIRDGRLHMNVAQRSSDILWGFSGIDIFAWSVLQQMMAYWVGHPVGTLSYNITSWHLYEDHWKRAQDILSAAPPSTIYQLGFKPAEFSTPFKQFDLELNAIFILEAAIRNGADVKRTLEIQIGDNFLWECVEMLRIYNVYNRQGEPKLHSLADDLTALPSGDFKIAAIEFFVRRFPSVREYLNLSPLEGSALTMVVD